MKHHSHKIDQSRHSISVSAFGKVDRRHARNGKNLVHRLVEVNARYSRLHWGTQRDRTKMGDVGQDGCLLQVRHFFKSAGFSKLCHGGVLGYQVRPNLVVFIDLKY